MSNDHDTASETTTRRVLTALIPFLLAVPILIVAGVLWQRKLPKDGSIALILFSIFCAIAVVNLFVCALVLFKWLWTGEPPDLSIYLLSAYQLKTRHRPKLNDTEFYDTFYAESNIRRHLPGDLRKMIEYGTGRNLAALWPTDNLVELDGELDWADVFFRIEREFKIPFPIEVAEHWDGTFDSLLRLIVAQGKKVHTGIANNSLASKRKSPKTGVPRTD